MLSGATPLFDAGNSQNSWFAGGGVEVLVGKNAFAPATRFRRRSSKVALKVHILRQQMRWPEERSPHLFHDATATGFRRPG